MFRVTLALVVDTWVKFTFARVAPPPFRVSLANTLASVWPPEAPIIAVPASFTALITAFTGTGVTEAQLFEEIGSLLVPEIHAVFK